MIRQLQLTGFLVIVAFGLSASASSQNLVREPHGAAIAPGGSAAPQSPDEKVHPEERGDPLEPFNQAMFMFNRKADDWVLHPSPPDGPT
jgi:ABC-type transporter lipoprotein component MlaA